MRKLLISTTALSVAFSPVGTFPAFAQTLAEDGSVIAPDGTVLCVPSSDVVCDIDVIIEEYLAAQALAAELAAAEAAAAEAAAVVEAEAAALAETLAAEQAEADAAAQAEADAAVQAEADAAAQAEADAAATQAAAEAEAAAAAQVEADAAAAEAAAQAEAEAAAQAEAEAAAAAQAAAEAEAAAMAQAQEVQAEADKAAQAAADALAAGDAEAAALAAALAEEQAAAAAVAQAEADAATAAAATAEAEAAAAAALAETEAAAEAAAAAETEAAAKASIEADAAAAEAAATAETEAAAEATVEAEAAAEEASTDAEVKTDDTDPSLVDEGVFEAATGSFIDPEVAAEAVAEAEAELAISSTGEMIDPAASLRVAEPETMELLEPVDVPSVSETEVESLTDLLTVNPTTFDPEALAAAEFVTPPVAEGEAAVVTTTDPAKLIANMTQVITMENVRTSGEEFAAAPVEVSSGKRNRLSDLEKAGLIVLGALVVGAIIKSNNDRQEESRVVSNTGDRVIVLRPDGTYQVLKDDDTIIRRPGSTVQTETFRDGSTRTIVTRQDGTQVVTIRDATGRVLRRATYDGLGREIVLIDDLVREEVVIIRDLPRPETRIIISTKDNDVALKRELAALEADKAGRKFSLRQIREIREVRALAATIDVEPVTFASGSAAIKAEEARNLADLGQVMQDLLDVNPGEVFLIMGHTDATGKAALNLALSDRRAESVALALTEYFDIPPENMIVQGYGETELLIDTEANEPANRRVEVKVITPLMRTTYVE